jgi:hypothetical protein
MFYCIEGVLWLGTAGELPIPDGDSKWLAADGALVVMTLIVFGRRCGGIVVSMPLLVADTCDIVVLGRG